MSCFLQRIKNHHASSDGKVVAKILNIEVTGDDPAISKWLDSDVKVAIGNGIEVEWASMKANDGKSGIFAVEVETSPGKFLVD